MKILSLGMIIFCIAFLLHLMIWKIHVPKSHKRTLLQIFFATLLISFIILSFVTNLLIIEYLHIFLLFVALTLAYITTYSSIEVDSPTLVIINAIVNAGKNGLEKNMLIERLSEEMLIEPRIKDLLADKMIYLSDKKYKLTKSGLWLAKIFTFYRKLLNADKGG